MTTHIHTWVGVGDEAHISVEVGGPVAQYVNENLGTLVEDGVASGIAAKDYTLWGEEAEAESKIRLNWTELHESSREILPQLDQLSTELLAEGKTRVVLCGMGGSSLGPEVICATYGKDLVTLDATTPDQVRDALAGDLASTVVVVSSKSGGTVETDSQRRAFVAAFEEAGLTPKEHIVVVTDPGSPLSELATEADYRAMFYADPNVGGRFSVLSAFGLVPSALAGVPVYELLDEAAAVAGSFAEDEVSNPALVLGAAMADPARPTLVFSTQGSDLVGFADWAEQLIAESTGKSGKGILPVVAEADAPDAGLANVTDTRLVSLDDETDFDGVAVAGTLGGQFLLWEYATSVASRLLGISPFDQPNVESAKKAARALLDELPEPSAPAFVDDGIEVRASGSLSLDGIDTVAEALVALDSVLDNDGYVAVMAYLDRLRYASLADVRRGIAARVARPVTFGWGPRFLHSTGQLHKGGAPVGVFLQITGTFAEDLAIPDRPFTFGQLVRAQADGDANVLAEHDLPVLRLNLTDASQVERVRTLLLG